MTFGRLRGGRFLHLGPAACQAATDQRASCPGAPYRLFLVTLALFVALSGCRAPVEVEGDLPVEPFDRRLSSLTHDPGDQWYAVAIRGQSPGPYLTVEYEGETHLFATRDHGERSAKLLPLTRPDPQWIENAYENSPTLEFHDDLRHRTVDSTLGKWRGGDAQEVRWLGPEPKMAKRAVVVATEFGEGPESLPARILGTARIDADGVSDLDGDFSRADGPYLLIPDGPVTETGPRAVSMLGNSPVDVDFDGWTLEAVEAAEVTNTADLGELAGVHSVEVAIARQGSDIRIGFATDGGMPQRGRWSRPVALAESGLVLDGDAGEEAMQAALRAVDDLYRDHPLSAAHRLQAIDGYWSVDHNRKATELRHQDLVAAAGYIPWMRAALLESAEGVGPEMSLYLARAYAYAGHGEAVLHYADRAVRFFSEWPPEHGAIGMARARLLMGDAHFAAGEDEAALESIQRARGDYLRAGDEYRAALVWRRLLLEGEFDDIDAVVRALAEAGAEYAASRTLLLMVVRAVEEGELDVATARLRDWTDRFGAEAPSRLIWLSRAVSTRIDWLGGDGIDGEQIAQWEVEAERSRAWEAMLAFALTRHEWRAMHEKTDLERLGRLLVEGRTRSYSELFSADIDGTLAVICTDLAFSGRAPNDEAVDRYCESHIDEAVTTVEGLISLLEGGYRFIQRGELGAAEELERFVFDTLPGDDQWPAAKVKAHLYRAAVAEELRLIEAPIGEDERDVAAALQRSFDILDEYLPDDEAPRVLMDLGELFELRGMDRIAVALYGAAVDAARDAELDREIFESSLEFARACHRARAWEELATMDNVGSPLHAVRIDLYRGHAEVMRGQLEAGEALLDATLESVAEFGALQMLAVRELAARLALERDDVEDARHQVDRAFSAMEDFPEGMAERDEARALEAALMAAETRIRAIDGESAMARERAGEVVAKLPELEGQEFLERLELRAYEAAIEVAHMPDERRELVKRLDERSRQWADTASPRAQRDVSRLIAGYHIEDGAPDRALDRVQSLLGEGLGLSSNRREHHCTIAETQLYAEEGAEEFHLQRCTAASDLASAVGVQLLDALARRESGLTQYRGELARHLADMVAAAVLGERQRLQWLAEFSTPTLEEDEQRAFELEDDFSYSRAGVDPEDPDEEMEWETRARIEAAADYVDHLIATGRYDDAEAQLSDAGAAGRWYFGDELEAEDLWMLLRVRLAARSLQPFAALDYVDEALEDVPPQTAERAARLHYYRAAAHLQLRQRLPALEAIADAREYVEAESETEERLDALESVVRADR